MFLTFTKGRAKTFIEFTIRVVKMSFMYIYNGLKYVYMLDFCLSLHRNETKLKFENNTYLPYVERIRDRISRMYHPNKIVVNIVGLW